jgi:hypothetical protein
MMVGIAAAASAVQPDDRAIRVKTKANSMLTRDDGGRARTRTRVAAMIHHAAAQRYESGVSIGLHAWSITSITSINPRAADSVKNILQYRHINGGIVRLRPECAVAPPPPDGSGECMGTM